MKSTENHCKFNQYRFVGELMNNKTGIKLARKKKKTFVYRNFKIDFWRLWREKEVKQTIVPATGKVNPAYCILLKILVTYYLEIFI